MNDIEISSMNTAGSETKYMLSWLISNYVTFRERKLMNAISLIYFSIDKVKLTLGLGLQGGYH